jgi:hypothetical protein
MHGFIFFHYFYFQLQRITIWIFEHVLTMNSIIIFVRASRWEKYDVIADYRFIAHS